MSSVFHRGFRVWQMCVVLAGIVLALIFAPSVAFARSYTVDAVTISSSVDTSGNLWVIERRTYVFDGAFNGIKWTVPRGTFEGREIEPQVYAISVEAKGETTEIFLAENLSSSFEFEHEDSGDVITINWPAEDETVTFQVEYELTNLVSRWSDVAELYWQYVPAAPGGATWNNITFTVSLPVPEGETIVAGENVRAWGHGPLNGEVSVAENGVAFTCPLVEDADCLEARVVFPESWVPDAEQASEAKLDTILEEEAAWANEANSQRLRDRLTAFGIPGALCVLGIGSVVFERIRARLRSRKSATPTFTEEYLRDVPNNDHPVVWGQLMNEGILGSDCFAATLLRLADQGCVRLDAVRDGAGKNDWRISHTKKGVGSDTIDNAAYKLLFKVVPEALRKDGNDPSVLISEINEAAKEEPSAYSGAYSAWDTASREAYKAKKYEKRTSRQDDLVVGMVGIADVALIVVLGFTGVFLGAPAWLIVIGIIVCFAGALWCIWHFDECEDDIYLTQEGADLKAKLEALRRWLLDFTNLKEAIPTDVVLWNRLLVAATALGVAKEVVKQLRIHVPKLFEDNRFVASSWGKSAKANVEADTFELPYAAFASAALKGKVTASSKLGGSSSSSSSPSSRESSYNTRDSSYDGSGGGFSGGGGGGFSGGGRGDAF